MLRLVRLSSLFANHACRFSTGAGKKERRKYFLSSSYPKYLSEWLKPCCVSDLPEFGLIEHQTRIQNTFLILIRSYSWEWNEESSGENEAAGTVFLQSYKNGCYWLQRCLCWNRFIKIAPAHTLTPLLIIFWYSPIINFSHDISISNLKFSREEDDEETYQEHVRTVISK